jgi:hypothetical protein
LAGRTTRRVPLRDLWVLLDEADPTLGMNARRRTVLADVLAELDAAGVVTRPSERSYDRDERPELPLFVTLPRRDRPRAPRRDVVWHPVLDWVPDSQLAPSQRADLEQVNRWLHGRRKPTPVPLRERSLEIFGDEKTLDRLLPTRLFAPDRLTLERLATYRAVVRFTSDLVGSGDLLLVAENSDTFDSLVHALRGRDGHRVGRVGWGAGAAFEASVLSVGLLDPPVADVAYFGDLDEKGLRIPANAAALAAREGLPPIRPASGLYSALLLRARPAAVRRTIAAPTATELTAWLDPAHRADVRTLLVGGRRAAQEAVGRDYLTSHDGWLADLT